MHYMQEFRVRRRLEKCPVILGLCVLSSSYHDNNTSSNSEAIIFQTEAQSCRNETRSSLLTACSQEGNSLHRRAPGMELFVNSSLNTANSTTMYYSEKFVTFSLVLDVLELLSALAAIVINCLVIIALTIVIRSFSCRVYFNAFLKLSFAHCLLSLLAVAEFVALQLQSRFHSGSNLKLALIVLRNTRIAVFCGLSIPGIATISWINWWILNVLTNHVDRPTGSGIASVMSRVLWFSALMFTFWLNAPMMYSKGNLESNIIPETERAIHYFLRLYSLVLTVSLIILIFSSFTEIPPVVGHLTSRSIQTKLKCLNHASCDADCVCSDSEVENSDHKMCKKDVSHLRSLDSNQFANESQQTDLADSNINALICTTILSPHQAISLKESDKNYNCYVRDCILEDNNHSFLMTSTPNQPRIIISTMDYGNSSNQPVSDACDSLAINSGCNASCKNSSIYSADLSTNSACERTNANKLTGPRLQQRLQSLRINRQTSEVKHDSQQAWQDEDSESPADSKVRKKRSKRHFKRFRRIIMISPSKLQLLTIAAFVLLYTPPLILLLLASAFPMSIKLLLHLFRISLNVTCCVNPIVNWLRHPRLATRLVRFRQKILPVKTKL